MVCIVVVVVVGGLKKVEGEEKGGLGNWSG